jgi:hypothetical protein
LLVLAVMVLLLQFLEHLLLMLAVVVAQHKQQLLRLVAVQAVGVMALD